MVPRRTYATTILVSIYGTIFSNTEYPYYKSSMYESAYFIKSGVLSVIPPYIRSMYRQTVGSSLFIFI